MPINIETRDAPGWWLKRCYDKLFDRDRQELLADLYLRYEGDAPLPPSLIHAPVSAQAFFRTSRTNFAEMVVKAVLYRLSVAYIQTANDNSETGDSQAWALWRRAQMVQAHKDGMRNALISGNAYFIGAMHRGTPVVTAEDPRQTITIHDPVFQHEILALGKFFYDELAGYNYAVLHRPGRVFWARQERKRPGRIVFNKNWEWDPDRGGEDGRPLPDGFEDAVLGWRLRDDEGVGEFTRHRDVFDRIDHLVLQGMVIATYQAFRQRAIKVDDEDMPDEDPETGQPINYDDVFSADPGALWKLPAAAEMWESGAVDTTPITTMVMKEMQKAAAVTFTSLAVFTPEGANQSAQGASLVREGQVFKVGDRQERFGDTFADIAAGIFRMAATTTEGDDADSLLRIADAETIRIGWAPSEWYGLTERATAGQAASVAGVPWRTIMRDIFGWSPEQVDRMDSERFNDLLLLPTEANFGLDGQTGNASVDQ